MKFSVGQVGEWLMDSASESQPSPRQPGYISAGECTKMTWYAISGGSDNISRLIHLLAV